MTALVPVTPVPALTYEQMYYRVKNELARYVMDRKTPQAIFNLRELMAELEAERVKPWRDYIEARRNRDAWAAPPAIEAKANTASARFLD